MKTGSRPSVRPSVRGGFFYLSSAVTVESMAAAALSFLLDGDGRVFLKHRDGGGGGWERAGSDAFNALVSKTTRNLQFETLRRPKGIAPPAQNGTYLLLPTAACRDAAEGSSHPSALCSRDNFEWRWATTCWRRRRRRIINGSARYSVSADGIFC